MSDRDFTYEFAIRWRHSRMGFGRNTTVEAQSAQDAISFGLADLGDQEFDVVELRRERIVSRVEAISHVTLAESAAILAAALEDPGPDTLPPRP